MKNNVAEIAPGRMLRTEPAAVVPIAALIVTVPAGAGLVRFRWRALPRYAPLDAARVQKMAPGVPRETFARLDRAGFITLVQVSPGISILCLQSFADHAAACRCDPQFWKRPENFNRWRQAL